MRVIFVTGTDTGVGKTVVMALLAARLADSRANFRAVKPFCSGERTDALLLWELQHGRLAMDEVNPFYFTEPLSPWTAARRAGRRVVLDEALAFLRGQACDTLLVEGAGGLLSPLGEGFTAADLIVRLRAEVVLAAANRLGVINHTLLTVDHLQRCGVSAVRLALVDGAGPVADEAADSNEADLRLLRPALPLVRIPRLAGYAPRGDLVRKFAEELASELKTLLLPGAQ